MLAAKRYDSFQFRIIGNQNGLHVKLLQIESVFGPIQWGS